MAIMRWEPFREFETLQTLFNQAFDAAATQRGWQPAMDLVESAGTYMLRADLPGMKLEDVSIEVDNGTLTLSGERARDPREGQDGFYRLERPSGKFSRTLHLPKGVDVEAITATFADGVLEVAIPKPEAPKPHRVEITAGDRPATIEA